MINESELRFGNWVFDKNKQAYSQIIKFVTGGVHFTDGTNATLNAIYPISLNNELLKRFGFVDISSDNNNNAVRLRINNSQEFFFYKEDGFIRFQSIGSGYSMNFEGRINNLHLLQNLYFYITGKELTNDHI